MTGQVPRCPAGAGSRSSGEPARTNSIARSRRESHLYSTRPERAGPVARSWEAVAQTEDRDWTRTARTRTNGARAAKALQGLRRRAGSAVSLSWGEADRFVRGLRE